MCSQASTILAWDFEDGDLAPDVQVPGAGGSVEGALFDPPGPLPVNVVPSPTGSGDLAAQVQLSPGFSGIGGLGFILTNLTPEPAVVTGAEFQFSSSIFLDEFVIDFSPNPATVWIEIDDGLMAGPDSLTTYRPDPTAFGTNPFVLDPGQSMGLRIRGFLDSGPSAFLFVEHFQFEGTVVPEPSASLLLLTGGLGFLLARRSVRNRK